MNHKIDRVLFLSSAEKVEGAEISLITFLNCYSYESPVEVFACSNDLLERIDLPSSRRHKVDWSRKVKTTLWLIKKIQTLGKEEKVTVVIFNLNLGVISLVLKAVCFSRIKIILDLHDYLPSRLGRFKLNMLAICVDGVVAVSRFAASQLVLKQKTISIYRPVALEMSFLKNREKQLQAKVSVGVLARLDPDKNLEFVIGIARLRPNINFFVYGEPSKEFSDYSQNLIDNSRGIQNLTWMGRVPPNEIYSAIDVLLCANPSEALGRSILEAKILGIPVVGPNRGGFSEIQGMSFSGQVFNSESPASAAEAIELVLRSEQGELDRDASHWQQETSPHKYVKDYFDALGRLQEGIN
jgi:glycosyltransferase involved in cell wall biosynthesis